MEKHLDFTIDFETCSLSANAAVMQVAVVPWKRYEDKDPFCSEQGLMPYVGYVDLRTCVVDGFDFDQETVKWWTSRSYGAKNAVTAGNPVPIINVLDHVTCYIDRIREQVHLESICLWSQGMDVDIAILRNLCSKYGVDIDDVAKHTQFRDCRTIILEAALIKAERNLKGGSNRVKVNSVVTPSEVLSGNHDVYSLFDPLPDEYAKGSEAHDALYDAMRSSWNTWQALKWLRSS